MIKQLLISGLRDFVIAFAGLVSRSGQVAGQRVGLLILRLRLMQHLNPPLNNHALACHAAGILWRSI